MADKREAHLAMIQGVINRLAQNSFLLKGWSVLLVSALLAVAASSSEDWILPVAFLPTAAFWGLDGYYLRQERLFRRLYDHAREVDEAERRLRHGHGSVPIRREMAERRTLPHALCLPRHARRGSRDRHRHRVHTRLSHGPESLLQLRIQRHLAGQSSPQ